MAGNIQVVKNPSPEQLPTYWGTGPLRTLLKKALAEKPAAFRMEIGAIGDQTNVQAAANAALKADEGKWQGIFFGIANDPRPDDSEINANGHKLLVPAGLADSNTLNVFSFTQGVGGKTVAVRLGSITSNEQTLNASVKQIAESTIQTVDFAMFASDKNEKRDSFLIEVTGAATGLIDGLKKWLAGKGDWLLAGAGKGLATATAMHAMSMQARVNLGESYHKGTHVFIGFGAGNVAQTPADVTLYGITYG